MAHYWEIGEGELPGWMIDSELTSEQRLIIAVLKRAVGDLRSDDVTWREEAQAWFAGHRGSLA
jgi:hypothetical protein